LFGAAGQLLQFRSGLVEFGDALVDLGSPLCDELADVLAGRLAAIADVEDLADLAQGEPGALGVFDERHPFHGSGRVVTVAGAGPLRGGQQAFVLVEAEGLGGGSGVLGQLASPATSRQRGSLVRLAPNGTRWRWCQSMTGSSASMTSSERTRGSASAACAV
jgi:hypothetical protein